MRYAAPTLIASLLLTGCLLHGPDRSRAAPRHAAVVGSVETTAPADAAMVRAALVQFRNARDAYRTYARACRCFGREPALHVARRPDRDAPAALWMAAFKKWHVQHRTFHRRLARLVDRMRKPGGTSCGTRWLPLARWVGWRESVLPWLASIIYRESSGRARAYNPVISCTGLTQIWPGNVSYTHLSWSGRIRWLMDPENNLRAALRLYREAGSAPWAL